MEYLLLIYAKGIRDSGGRYPAARKWPLLEQGGVEA